MTLTMGKTPLEVENERIESALADVCGTVNAVSARVCSLVAEALASKAWEGDGIVSVEHWVRLQTGASAAHASRVVAVARRWAELPATMGMFSAGTLSFDQVAVIARAIPAHADAEVAELAQFATVSQLSRIVNGYPWPDPDGTEEPGCGSGAGHPVRHQRQGRLGAANPAASRRRGTGRSGPGRQTGRARRRPGTR